MLVERAEPGCSLACCLVVQPLISHHPAGLAAGQTRLMALPWALPAQPGAEVSSALTMSTALLGPLRAASQSTMGAAERGHCCHWGEASCSASQLLLSLFI